MDATNFSVRKTLGNILDKAQAESSSGRGQSSRDDDGYSRGSRYRVDTREVGVAADRGGESMARRPFLRNERPPAVTWASV
ncbi:hypothetical protein MRX96_020994 [Rhipicephalus microplus]